MRSLYRTDQHLPYWTTPKLLHRRSPAQGVFPRHQGCPFCKLNAYFCHWWKWLPCWNSMASCPFLPAMAATEYFVVVIAVFIRDKKKCDWLRLELTFHRWNRPNPFIFYDIWQLQSLQSFLQKPNQSSPLKNLIDIDDTAITFWSNNKSDFHSS